MKKKKVLLNSEQEMKLRGMLKKGRWSPRELKRAEILIMAHGQKIINKKAISEKLKCGREKVIRVLQRFQKNHDLDKALFELPRPGQPKRLDSKEEALVVATACSDSPEGSSVWTLRLLQENFQKNKKKTVGQTTIGKILMEHELKPWKKKDVVRPKTHRKVHSQNG